MRKYRPREFAESVRWRALTRDGFTYPQALQLDMVEDKKAILAAVFEYINRVM